MWTNFCDVVRIIICVITIGINSPIVAQVDALQIFMEVKNLPKVWDTYSYSRYMDINREESDI